MKATAAISIAALVAALTAMPALELETNADANELTGANASAGSNGIDAASVNPIDVSADGSVDVYEG